VPTPTPTATPTQTPLQAGFIGHSGSQFTLGGQPFVFTGFNIYQANSRSNCSVTMGTGSGLDTALSSIGSGSEVFRAWFFQSLATTGGARDWSAFDHTLAVAKAHGVKVVVTLGNQWGSCEGSQYLTDSWYAGGYKTQVISGDTVPYRQYVQEIVNRYKNDPTIAMWQLINEAEIKTGQSASSCSSTTDLYNFTADVSSLIKSIDSNHLVNLGQMGGGQCGSQGNDYQLLGSIPTIDVLEYHDYGHDGEAMPANLSRDVSVSKSLGKPIFVGEAGIQVGSSCTLAARATELHAKIDAAQAAGVGGWLVWSWNSSPSNPASWEVGPGDPALGVVDSH
jgi:endo-1,4-beta-mannosidase